MTTRLTNKTFTCQICRSQYHVCAATPVIAKEEAFEWLDKHKRQHWQEALERAARMLGQ